MEAQRETIVSYLCNIRQRGVISYRGPLPFFAKQNLNPLNLSPRPRAVIHVHVHMRVTL
jgi:hypothetical protein